MGPPVALQRQSPPVTAVSVRDARTAAGPGVTGFPDILYGDAPHDCRTFTQDSNRLARGKYGGHAGGKCAPTAFRCVVVAQLPDIPGYGLLPAHRECPALQRLSVTARPWSHRTSMVPTVRVTEPSVAILKIGAGLPAKVKPESTGHAPTLVFLEPGSHMGVLFYSLKGGADADGAVDRPIARARSSRAAFLMRKSTGSTPSSFATISMGSPRQRDDGAEGGTDRRRLSGGLPPGCSPQPLHSPGYNRPRKPSPRSWPRACGNSAHSRAAW